MASGELTSYVPVPIEKSLGKEKPRMVAQSKGNNNWHKMEWEGIKLGTGTSSPGGQAKSGMSCPVTLYG